MFRPLTPHQVAPNVFCFFLWLKCTVIKMLLLIIQKCCCIYGIQKYHTLYSTKCHHLLFKANGASCRLMYMKVNKSLDENLLNIMP